MEGYAIAGAGAIAVDAETEYGAERRDKGLGNLAALGILYERNVY